jgi:2-polyprenyl-3-methyl-5-hydroxy-6-metoxy-1,4-benzoquinol methylase
MEFVYDLNISAADVNTSHGQILDMVGFHKSVLEVGCATGYTTKILVEHGCIVSGIELNATAAKMAEKHARRVVVGDLNDPQIWDEFANEKFDVITFGDVLEHLTDPLAVLRSSVKHLDPSGMIIISIPNIAHIDMRISLMNGKFDYNDWGLLDRTHLRFFTRKSVISLVREAGLVPIELRRIIVPPFCSELPVAREDVDDRLLGEMLQDPDAETLQFIVRAVPDDANHHVWKMAERLDKLETQLYESKMQIMRFHDLEYAFNSQSQQLERVQKELTATYQTKIMRAMRLPRTVWGYIRRARGALR